VLGVPVGRRGSGAAPGVATARAAVLGPVVRMAVTVRDVGLAASAAASGTAGAPAGAGLGLGAVAPRVARFSAAVGHFSLVSFDTFDFFKGFQFLSLSPVSEQIRFEGPL
jgi:hypothetical protein